MKRFRITDLHPQGSRLMPDIFGQRAIAMGGLRIFHADEAPHRSPYVHDSDEVLLFVQGRGMLIAEGGEYPVTAGDIVIIEAGESHNLVSEADDPLAAARYVMEPDE
jgi:mannose-6-phosphate isomerase-like protein (cupin superfamily)